MNKPALSTCKHCGISIRHFFNTLWHEYDPAQPEKRYVFPQYCKSETPSAQLHEPVVDCYYYLCDKHGTIVEATAHETLAAAEKAVSELYAGKPVNIIPDRNPSLRVGERFGEW